MEPASEDLSQSLGSVIHSLLTLEASHVPLWYLVSNLQYVDVWANGLEAFSALSILLFSLIPKEPFGLAQTLMLSLPGLKMDIITLCSLPQRSPHMKSVGFRVLRGKRYSGPFTSMDSTNHGSNTLEKKKIPESPQKQT